MSDEDRFHAELKKEFLLDPTRAVTRHETVEIQVLDRPITTLHLESVDVDVWMEDELDVCMHILPPESIASFFDFHLAREQIDRVLGHHFGDVPGVTADGDFYGWRTGESNVCRRTNVDDKGRDMFFVRLRKVWKQPGAARACVKAVMRFNDILRYIEPAY